MLFLLLIGLLQELPDGPGKKEVLNLCRECHDLDAVISDNRTKEGWKKTVAKMGERGAEGTDEQFDAIISYLAKNFGRIDVNKASAEEIAAGLDFSAKEAAAIVAYRDKNGAYKDWQDLKKVEGLDAAKIEPRKNHIAVK